MNTNLFNIKQLILLFIIIGFSGCYDDEEADKSYSIIGEWFSDESDKDQVFRSTLEFGNNGYFSQWHAQIGINVNKNNVSVGTYSCDKKIDIVYSTKYDSRKYHETWQIVNLNENTVSFFNEMSSEIKSYTRIVKSYEMNIGEKKAISELNIGKNIIGYKSYDNNIVTIEDGYLFALSGGTTFVKIICNEDEIIVRIHVKNSTAILDNYVQYIGQPIDSITKVLGNNYQKEQNSTNFTNFKYNLLDEILRNVTFSFVVRNHINRIRGIFQSSVDIPMIVSSFDSNQKYEKRESPDKRCHKYRTFTEEYEVIIYIDESKRSIEFFQNPNPLLEFDGMIMLTIDDIVSWFNIKIENTSKMSNGDDYFEIYNINEYIDRVAFAFNPTTRKMSGIVLVCNYDEIASEAIWWIMNHYYKHNHPERGNIWTTSEIYPRTQYYIQMFFNSKKNIITIQYMRT